MDNLATVASQVGILFALMGIQTAHYATRMFTQKEGDIDGKNK